MNVLPALLARFRDASIKRKLTLIIMLTTTAALLAACGAFVINDVISYKRAVVKDLSTKAEIIGNSSTAALSFNDPRPAEEIMTALKVDPHLISASVLNEDGKILAEYIRADHRWSFLRPTLPKSGHRFEKGYVVVYHPIEFNGGIIGAVSLQMDLQEMRERYQRYTGIVATVLLTSLAVAFFVSSKLQRVISDPILHLARTANAVAEQKNYSVRASKTSRDELGRLIDGFNEMLAQIQAREAALEKEIAERRKTEHALRQSQERFSKAFQASSVAVGIISASNSRFLEVNDFFLRLFGYRRDEVIGRTALDLSLWENPQHRAKLLKLARERGSVRDFESQFRTKSGEIRNTLVSVESVELGNEPCFLFVTHDITDRLNLEAQLRQSQKMEAVGQLAAGVAHDFNNILTVIHGHTDLLLSRTSLDDEMSDSLRQISMASVQAANLTRQLLTFSRRQILQLYPLNLNEIVEQAAQMLRRTLGEHVALKCNCSSKLPAIRGDSGMLQQLIMNLAVNARDAMPRGGVLTLSTDTVRIDAEHAKVQPEARPGDAVCLTVVDTGCGMDSATLARIFEPFFTTKDVGKGTGLGLAMAYGIVSQHQGWIEVSSAVGVGTTFRLYFPYDLDTVAAAPATDAGPALRGGSETIFVVEDEPKVRRFVCHLLRQYGYQVIEASSGIEALNLWREKRPHVDLLITDMMMPGGVFGRDLAEKLQGIEPTLKVIFTSGYAFDSAGDSFALEEGRNFLPKPYPVSKLIHLVRTVLDESRNERIPTEKT